MNLRLSESNAAENRRHARFRVAPMYTPVVLRTIDNPKRALEGHAYNVSEGGLQFELDEAIDPGTPVTIELTLPLGEGEVWDGVSDLPVVTVQGNVVWTDTDEPGPIRMAMIFTRFANEMQKELISSRVLGKKFRNAA
jgi:hypothetical protein